MMRLLILSMLMALSLHLAPAGNAQQSQAKPPLVQVTDFDRVTRLQGWTRAPVSYSANRIVPAYDDNSKARVLTMESNLTSFTAGINECLRKDGVTNVKMQATETLEGPVLEKFKAATNLHNSTFKAWIATGSGSSGEVTIAGFSIITPSGNDPGVSADMFVAPTSEFESMGGWVVPVVRYFGLKLNNPHEDISVHGRADDQYAAEQMADFFEQWMQYILIGKDMAVISTLQTLSMQNRTGIVYE